MVFRATAALLFFSSLSMASTYYLATDQTGGQTQIDVNHSSTWVLNVTQSFDLGGGLFTMKAGNSASDTVSLHLYEGSNSSGALLASVTLTNSAFCAQVSNCGNYEFHQFFFTTPLALTSGNTYFAALTSGAPDTQSQAYFIKSDNFFASDINGTPVVPSPLDGITPPVTTTPEPGTFVLAGAGIMSIVLWKRRRSALPLQR